MRAARRQTKSAVGAFAGVDRLPLLHGETQQLAVYGVQATLFEDVDGTAQQYDRYWACAGAVRGLSLTAHRVVASKP